MVLAECVLGRRYPGRGVVQTAGQATRMRPKRKAVCARLGLSRHLGRVRCKYVKS
jgi:hypothetical protein